MGTGTVMIRVSLSRDCAAGQEHVDKTQVRGMTHRDTDDMVRCATMLWRGSSFDSNGESEKEPLQKKNQNRIQYDASNRAFVLFRAWTFGSRDSDRWKKMPSAAGFACREFGLLLRNLTPKYAVGSGSRKIPCTVLVCGGLLPVCNLVAVTRRGV